MLCDNLSDILSLSPILPIGSCGVLQPVDLSFSAGCELILKNSVNLCCELVHRFRCRARPIDPVHFALCARYLTQQYSLFNQHCLTPLE